MSNILFIGPPGEDGTDAWPYAPITPYEAAEGFGTTQEANTNALQLALDECVGPVSAPHGFAGIYTNKNLYVPPGSFISGPLFAKHVMGFQMYGAAMNVTRLYNPDSDDGLFSVNGFSRCSVSHMALERGAVGTCFNLDWDGSAGGNALQENTFHKLDLGGGEYGFKVAFGGGGSMGSENRWDACMFNSHEVAGLAIGAANSLQNSVRDGNIVGCGKGIYVISGSAPLIDNVAFQNQREWDIDILQAPTADGSVILGCRSESKNFLRVAEGHVMLIGVTHVGNSVAPGKFIKADGGVVTVENSASNYGDIRVRVAGQVRAVDCAFGRSDFMIIDGTGGGLRHYPNAPGHAVLENITFGYGDSDPVLYKYISGPQKYQGGVGGGEILIEVVEGTRFVARVSTQFDKTTATLANVTELVTRVQDGRIYRFKAQLFVTADATGGYKVALSGTAVLTSALYQIKIIDNGTNAIIVADKKTALDSSSSGATGTDVLIEIEGEIEVDVSGSLTVQFAQSTANGTSSVVVGSNLTVSRYDPIVDASTPGYLYKASGATLPLLYHDLQSQRFYYSAVAYSTLGEWLTAASGTVNLVQSSEDIAEADGNNDWTHASISVSGQTFTESSTSAPHAVFPIITAPDLTATATFQCKLKAGTRAFAYVGMQGPEGDGATIVVDLANGVLGEEWVGASSGEILDSSITSLGSGVYLVTLTAEMETSGGIIVPKIGMAAAASGNTFDAAGNPTFLGSGKTILAYEPQFEFGLTASTYIPTKSASVAIRTATNAAIVSGLMIETAGVEIAAATEQVFWQRDDGTENERIRLVRKVDTHIYLIVTDGGVEQCSLDLGAVADAAEFKIAFRVQVNDFAACLDGGAVVADTSGTMPTITRERFGADTTTGDQWQSEYTIREIWTVALLDAELQALTT